MESVRSCEETLENVCQVDEHFIIFTLFLLNNVPHQLNDFSSSFQPVGIRLFFCKRAEYPKAVISIFLDYRPVKFQNRL